MVAIPDLYRLLFETVLQLPRCTGSDGWGCWVGPENFAHDFIYALFLPHIVILIFLYIFSKGVGHRGLEILFGIGVYVFIIYAGLYSILAALSIFWILLGLIMGGIYFFIGKVIHPEKSDALYKMARQKGKESKKKEKNLEKAFEELDTIENKIQEADQKRNNEELSEGAYNRIIVELERDRRKIERRIRELERG